MFSYFGSKDNADTPTAQPSSKGVTPGTETVTMAGIEAAEKENLILAIDRNKYERRSGAWRFRRGLNLFDYLMRATLLSCFFVIALLSRPVSSKGREDRDWLVQFSMTMLIWFTALHAIAYMPSSVFGSFADLRRSVFGQASYAY